MQYARGGLLGACREGGMLRDSRLPNDHTHAHIYACFVLLFFTTRTHTHPHADMHTGTGSDIAGTFGGRRHQLEWCVHSTDQPTGDAAWDFWDVLAALGCMLQTFYKPGLAQSTINVGRHWRTADGVGYCKASMHYVCSRVPYNVVVACDQVAFRYHSCNKLGNKGHVGAGAVAPPCIQLK